MLWTNLFNARTFSASPGGIETEAKMKSETEVEDEAGDEAGDDAGAAAAAESDRSMRRTSETINYAKYLLLCEYVCACVCVCINLVKFGFGCAGCVPLQPARDWLDIDTAPCGDAFSISIIGKPTLSPPWSIRSIWSTLRLLLLFYCYCYCYYYCYSYLD